MGVLELITLILFLAKVFGAISISWWGVLSPLVIAVALYIGMFMGFVAGVVDK